MRDNRDWSGPWALILSGLAALLSGCTAALVEEASSERVVSYPITDNYTIRLKHVSYADTRVRMGKTVRDDRYFWVCIERVNKTTHEVEAFTLQYTDPKYVTYDVRMDSRRSEVHYHDVFYEQQKGQLVATHGRKAHNVVNRCLPRDNRCPRLNCPQTARPCCPMAWMRPSFTSTRMTVWFR